MGRRASIPVDAVGSDPELLQLIEASYDDPLLFVCTVFPFGEPGPLEHEEGPDIWQTQVLDEIGRRVKENDNAADGIADAIRLAVSSGHGIGKTALVAWLILWFISTRTNPQIVVTANTVSQLTTKTWRELAKWQRLSLNGSWFQWSAQKLAAKWAPDTWFATAVPWSKERAEAFAGTHEEHVLLIFDEASAIDDVIWEVAEGAMTTTGAMWLCFGNPTRNTGRFRECWRLFAKRWITMKVDSRAAKKASRKQIDAWIEDYGEDSDFVRVRVRGEFPNAATSQFIAEDDVEGAVARFERALKKKRDKALLLNRDPDSVSLGVEDSDDENAPLLIAADIARYGDDSTVVVARRGKIAKILDRWQGFATDQSASKIAEMALRLRPDALFVDEVGVGSGVVDQLRAQGFDVIGVNAGKKARNPKAYFNRRVEMFAATREWLRSGGMLEGDKKLRTGLTAMEYGFADRSGQLQLESKDDMKARGMDSPDEADALAMTFYEPVARRARREEAIQKRLVEMGVGGGGASWMSA